MTGIQSVKRKSKIILQMQIECTLQDLPSEFGLEFTERKRYQFTHGPLAARQLLSTYIEYYCYPSIFLRLLWSYRKLFMKCTFLYIWCCIRTLAPVKPFVFICVSYPWIHRSGQKASLWPGRTTCGVQVLSEALEILPTPSMVRFRSLYALLYAICFKISRNTK